ncbi:MAG: SBBP repeat-containing protein [Candidatus Hodarchaeota archaeon]
MDPTGTANFSTYLGGGGTDKGYSIACDNNGKCYVGGLTTSSNFPTSTGCYQDSRNGGSDGFITVLAWTDNPPTSTTPTSTTPSSTASTSQITSSSAPTASSDFFTIEILVIVFVSLTLIFIWRRKTRAT